MNAWPDHRSQVLFGIEHPIIQAPMANSAAAALAIGAAQGGGLGSIACAALSPERIREEVALFRAATRRPLNLNFFCHRTPRHDPDRERNWRRLFASYYDEFGIDPNAVVPAPTRAPFDDIAASLLEGVRASGAKIISSATTAEEARWLEEHGCDAIIAQGMEAAGHRGMFLT